jgi:hypothetical protein
VPLVQTKYKQLVRQEQGRPLAVHHLSVSAARACYLLLPAAGVRCRQRHAVPAQAQPSHHPLRHQVTQPAGG